MATAATIGKFAITHDGANIEEVLSVGGVGKTNDLIDVTNFDSAAGTKEYIAGLADGSEVSIECNYLESAAGQTALVADVDAQATAAFVLTYNSAVTYTFNAACMGYQITPSVSEQNKISFTIKISGDITKGTLP
jgi:hypothetical protein